MRRRGLVVALFVLVLACGSSVAPAAARTRIAPIEGQPPEVTAIEVTAVGPPRYVYGSDRRTHVDYDLAITNAFTATVTLRSLSVRGDGRTLLRLAGEDLAAHTHQIIAGEPTARVAASATVVTVVDVVLPRSVGRRAPRRLTNRIKYTIPPKAKFREAIGSTTVFGPSLRTARRAPVVIASPLPGAGWLGSSGCCADPSSRHRNVVLSANGNYVAPELFDVDWIKVKDDSAFRASGAQLSDWFGFGTTIHAVASGRVVETINDRPEAPLGAPESGNPTVRTPKEFSGNEVVEKIGPGRYAIYEHLETGSVMVRPGELLRTGETIARLGNSGNSSAPHLHFGIHDGPNTLTSNSVPFELDHYVRQGSVSPRTTSISHLVITRSSSRQRRSYPLIPSVSAFATDASSSR